jgi:DNA-binding SARP family transcriptional activator
MPVPSWHLALLGRIELTGPDAAAAERVLVQPKHVALLAYLAIEDALGARGRFHRRDDLATLLWPELDQAHARASLRRVVHQIRTALGAEVLVSRGDEELALSDDELTSDVAEFTRAVAVGHLVAALELWSGDLMPGFHLGDCAEMEHRLDNRRSELREEAGATAWTLAERLENEKELTLAASWARRVPRFAPDNERVLRRALSMLDRLGDRAGALRVYDEFARRLHKEFEAEPSAETLALVARIRG